MKTKLFQSAIFAVSLTTVSTKDILLGMDGNGKKVDNKLMAVATTAKAIDGKNEKIIEENSEFELVDNSEGVFFSIIEK